MGKFNRGGDFGGKKFGGRDRSFDRNAPRQMYKAVCAECGNECEVPFKPSGDRPVLCSTCFKNSGRGEERSERRDDRREERGSFDRPRNDGDRKMYDATCAECGQHCQVPFQPKPGRDIYCSDCFGRDDKHEHEPKTFTPNQAPKPINYDKHFEAIHSKLDKIMIFLTNKPGTSIPLDKVTKPTAAIATADKPADKVEKIIAKKSDKKTSAKKNTSKKK